MAVSLIMLDASVLVAGAVVALGTLYFLLSEQPRKSKLSTGSDLKKQSVEVRKEDGASVRRSSVRPDKLLTHLRDEKVQTIRDIFTKATKLYPTAECLGTRSFEVAPGSKTPQRGNYVFRTYADVAKSVDHFASGLVAVGAKSGDRIGIYSKNREEWVVTEQACYRQNLIVVSLYDTLGEDSVEFIAKHSGAKIVLVSKENIGKLSPVAERLPSLEIIIQLEPRDGSTPLPSGRYKFYTFDEITEMGAKNVVPEEPPKPEDVSTIMYTSGTTGDPKGVVITHKSIIATLAGLEPQLDALCEPGDYYLSYLPLAHIFERVVVSAVLYKGGGIGFYQGDPRLLIDDILALRPSFFVGVPRVFDRIYDKIKSTIDQSGAVTRFLFHTAYNAKKQAIKRGKTTPLWDALIFKKFKSRLGGRVKAIVSGSAPLTSPVHEFLLVCFGCPVIQGYGLTETCAGATIADFDDVDVGHVGAPIPCGEIKLVDVPDMNYYSKNNQGEIAIRGDHLSSGYYRDEAKTKEDFRDGWFFTGDVGQWNPNGSLSIIDRKKNIFKLSQGEYIAAEKIEGVYARCKFIGQIFVYGDSTKSTLVAIVVPNAENLAIWAKSNSDFAAISGDLEKLCQSPAVNSMILKEMDTTGKALKLRGFEFVKKIHLHPVEFSTTNDLLTPTFKLKRPQLKAFFKEILDQLYVGLD